MTPFFFGQPDRQLFGVYHPARAGGSTSQKAVLICPPIGHEYFRTNWALRLLASQLARKGIHVLRMEYLGIGDSAGSVSDIKSLSIWQENICVAANELCMRSGVKNVALLGLRLGATMGWQTAVGHPDHFNSIISWEPIENGSTHIEELRMLHAQMLDLHHSKLTTVNNDQHEELLGSIYTKSLISDIETLAPQPDDLTMPHLSISLSATATKSSSNPPSTMKQIFVDGNDAWNDLSQIETAWLQPQISRTLVANIGDLFDRLSKFELLAAREDSHSRTTATLSPSADGDFSMASNQSAGV